MKEEDGAVFQILEFNGKLLVSVNSQVRVTVCVCEFDCVCVSVCV